MGKKELRNLPREQPGRYWPLLLVTAEDRSYIPIPESSAARRLRFMRTSLYMLLQDFVFVILKGTLLGLFFFAVVFGVLSRWAFWLSNWHWIFLIGGTIALIFLVGLDITLVILTISMLCLNLNAVLAQPLLPLFFAAGGLAMRCTIELLPRKTL